MKLNFLISLMLATFICCSFTARADLVFSAGYLASINSETGSLIYVHTKTEGLVRQGEVRILSANLVERAGTLATVDSAGELKYVKSPWGNYVRPGEVIIKQ